MKKAVMAAGAGILSPFLINMRAEAAGKVSLLPKRFVFLVRSNGLRSYGIDPIDVDKRKEAVGVVARGLTFSEELAGLKLHKDLRCLDPLKSKLNIIQGLNASMNVGAHTASYGALGAYRCAEGYAPTLPTLDALL